MKVNPLIAAAIALLESNSPDEEVNEAFALACGWVKTLPIDPGLAGDGWFNATLHVTEISPPHYCTSMDAVLFEMPEGWMYGTAVYTETATAYARNSVAITSYGKSGTPQRALMLAILRAMEAGGAS